MSEFYLVCFDFFPKLIVNSIGVITQVLINLRILQGIDIWEDSLVVLHVFIQQLECALVRSLEVPQQPITLTQQLKTLNIIKKST